jgi:cytochrome c oxidase assembly factor CtaG
MQPVTQAVLRSWSIPPAATFVIILSGFIYLRGWWLLRRAGSPNIPPWRAGTFLLGLFTLWVALASPMDVFNGFVLTAHMLQHMLLMMIAPPLILLGAPLVPTVRGLPIFAAREFAGPFLNWSVTKSIGTALSNPIFALILMGVVMFAWHTPGLYELALRSPAWHQMEHACFLISSLIFWWPVVQPWPSRSRWPRWAMVPYLLVADLQNTALSAILVFSDRVLYPSYSTVPRLFRFSALEDQVAAGSIMWVVGSLAFVVPAIVVAVECLSSKPLQAGIVTARPRQTSSFDSLPQEVSYPSRFVSARWRGEPTESVSFLLLFVTACLCLAWLLSSGSSDNDNQVLRYESVSPSLAVAVFAPPGSLEAGSSQFTVLVRNRSTQETLLDAKVDLTAQPANNSQALFARATASHEDSENKLLQAADLYLPTEGEWTLHITVQREAVSHDFLLAFRVTKPDAGIASKWPYLAILLFTASLLFAYVWRHRALGSLRFGRVCVTDGPGHDRP